MNKYRIYLHNNGTDFAIEVFCYDYKLMDVCMGMAQTFNAIYMRYEFIQ